MLDTPSAVLDLHFYPWSTTFAVASSTGTITFYIVEPNDYRESGSGENYGNFSKLVTHQVFDENVIITSFTWDTSGATLRPRMVVATNTGEIHVLEFIDETFKVFKFLNEDEPLIQHDQIYGSAWCAAFSTTDFSACISVFPLISSNSYISSIHASKI